MDRVAEGGWSDARRLAWHGDRSCGRTEDHDLFQIVPGPLSASSLFGYRSKTCSLIRFLLSARLPVAFLPIQLVQSTNRNYTWQCENGFENIKICVFFSVHFLFFFLTPPECFSQNHRLQRGSSRPNWHVLQRLT